MHNSGGHSARVGVSDAAKLLRAGGMRPLEIVLVGGGGAGDSACHIFPVFSGAFFLVCEWGWGEEEPETLQAVNRYHQYISKATQYRVTGCTKLKDRQYPGIR